MILGFFWVILGIIIFISGIVEYSTDVIELSVFIVILYLAAILLDLGIDRILKKSSIQNKKYNSFSNFVFLFLLVSFPVLLGICMLSEGKSPTIGIVLIISGFILLTIFFVPIVKQKKKNK